MGSKRKFDDSFFNLDSHLLSFLTKLVQSPTGNKIEVIENVGVTKVRAEVEKMERKKREREFFFRRSIAASLFFFAHLPPFFRPLQPLYLLLFHLLADRTSSTPSTSRTTASSPSTASRAFPG
jgi:hypothetical protein